MSWLIATNYKAKKRRGKVCSDPEKRKHHYSWKTVGEDTLKKNLANHNKKLVTEIGWGGRA